MKLYREWEEQLSRDEELDTEELELLRSVRRHLSRVIRNAQKGSANEAELLGGWEMVDDRISELDRRTGG